MASCMEMTAAWVLEIPVAQDARRLPTLPEYRGQEDYLLRAFLYPPPVWYSLRIIKDILPSPTSSPWSEG